MGRLVNFCAGVNLHTLPSKHVNAILWNLFDNAVNDQAISRTMAVNQAAGIQFQMLDSSGYQVHMAEKASKRMTFNDFKPIVDSKQEINVGPRHVIEAAAKLKPNFVIALDFPILTIEDPDDQHTEFMKKLGFNVSWAMESAHFRNSLCPEVQLLLPIQCYNLTQFKIYLQMIGNIQFDGFSMPIRNMSLSDIILFLGHFRQLGVTQVHILGAAAFFTIALLAYMARHHFDWLSFDATSWRLAADRGEYLNPFNLSREPIGSNVTVDENTAMDCPCPFCKDKTFTYIKNLPVTEKIHFLRCHNWWVTEEATRNLHNNSSTVVTLDKYLRSVSSKSKKIAELVSTISTFEALKDAGMDAMESILA